MEKLNIPSQPVKTFQRKVLRTIYRGKRVNDVWERQTNEELNEFYGEPLITNAFRANRIGWLGYLSRLGVARPTKHILTRGITGS